jgi:KDO2-lipid IV(A) lauroyltransferase
VVCVIQALSFQTACACARFLAWLAFRIDRRHREVALDNLRQAFPGRYTEAELRDLVKDVYRHLCKVMIEMAHMPRKVHLSNWAKFVHFPRAADPRRLLEPLFSRRPVMFVTGHFGNWEMAGSIIAALGFKIHSIARPIDNPYLDTYVRAFRERYGAKILAKKGDFDQIERLLAEGGLLGTLGDQDAGQRGQFVNFFGRPASTHKAIALLAMEHQTLLLVAGAARAADPMVYQVHVEDVIDPREYDGRPDAVRAITQRFTTALEQLVRRQPEQYFWLHRRWKHQPKKKAA